MKRRSFLVATGTVGIAGAVSGATVVSSAYSSISRSVLLEEFNSKSKNALDNFLAKVKLNVESLGLDAKFAEHIVMPVRIISNKIDAGHQKISYKNKSGNYISLSVIDGVERVEVQSKL